MEVAGSARLRFGVYELDLEARELRKNGRKVSLQDQPFQVLALLLAQPGRLVTREELQKRLWPADTFVDFDLGLNTAIKKIRAALSDSADNPRFVETLPRRGYRFMCPVEEILSSAAGVPPTRESTIAETGSSLKLPGHATESASSSRSRLWLTLGSLAVLALLASLSYYRLQYARRSRAALERLGERGTRNSAAFEFYTKGRSYLKDEGGTDRSDQAIQAFTQATAADPSYADAFGGLGEAYMKKFRATRQDQWQDQAQASCDHAMELDARRPAGVLCRGVIDYSLGDYSQAVKDFSAAIEIAPLNARAYRGRASAYKGWDKFEEAEKDYQKAITLDPHNWQSYSALARFYFDNSRYGDAARQYDAAIKIRPDDSGLHSSLGSAYVQMGMHDKAVKELKEAIRQEPTFQGYENLGLYLLYARQFPEAIETFTAAIGLNDPRVYLGYGGLARAYFWAPNQQDLARQNYQHAIDLARQKLIVNPGDADVHLMLAVYHAMLGQDEAQYEIELAEQKMPDQPEVAFWAAVVQLRLGHRARALARLRQALSLGYSAAEISAAPEFDSLRNDPEFRQIMSEPVRSPQGTNPALNRRAK